MSSTLQPTWRKSSFSNGTGGECVEIAALNVQTTAVRDSKSPDAPILRFPLPAWGAFVGAVRRGETLR